MSYNVSLTHGMEKISCRCPQSSLNGPFGSVGCGCPSPQLSRLSTICLIRLVPHYNFCCTRPNSTPDRLGFTSHCVPRFQSQAARRGRHSPIPPISSRDLPAASTLLLVLRRDEAYGLLFPSNPFSNTHQCHKCDHRWAPETRG